MSGVSPSINHMATHHSIAYTPFTLLDTCLSVTQWWHHHLYLSIALTLSPSLRDYNFHLSSRRFFLHYYIITAFPDLQFPTTPACYHIFQHCHTTSQWLFSGTSFSVHLSSFSTFNFMHTPQIHARQKVQQFPQTLPFSCSKSHLSLNPFQTLITITPPTRWRTSCLPGPCRIHTRITTKLPSVPVFHCSQLSYYLPSPYLYYTSLCFLQHSPSSPFSHIFS